MEPHHDAIFIPSYETILSALHSPTLSPFTSSSSLTSSRDSATDDDQAQSPPVSPSSHEVLNQTPSVDLIGPPHSLSPITEESESTPSSPSIVPVSEPAPLLQNEANSTPSPKAETDDSQLVKDLMRGQGALEALTQTTATPGFYLFSRKFHYQVNNYQAPLE